jgi:dipeptidyl-peptidase-4
VNGQLIEANGKRYPVVVMQYSGPESQRVLNRWKKGFGHYLACQGFVVINADGRGTGCRGRVWRNETYMQLGQKEAEDQISVGNYAASLPFVDGERMTIMGWSYGGFEVLMTMSKEGHPYRCGVAIAPVTDYRLYDTGYTERYMRRPQVNEAGYEGCALPEMADKLTGSLLIVHGLADDNVHAQNTLLYIDRLVQAGKQFEMQLYVDDNHSIRKPANYEHLHRRIMLFLEKNL